MLVLLALFLEIKLAGWVVLGIPTAFLGALLFLPGMGVSINMISMFAFIIALGIVVDDAIVAGENIYEYRRRGYGTREAAILGAREVPVPITFSILTNVVAFIPLYFLPGFLGQIFLVTPLVVGTVFAISWVEALLILPAHLAWTKRGGAGFLAPLRRGQERIAGGLDRFVAGPFRALLRAALTQRYLTVALAFAALIVMLGYAASGRLGFQLMPRVPSDEVEVTAEMPAGAPFAQTLAVRDALVTAAREVVADNGGEALARSVSAWVNDTEVDVEIELVPESERSLATTEVAERWREAAGTIAAAKAVRFATDAGGPGGGAGLTLELAHSDSDLLETAAERARTLLGEYPDVRDLRTTLGDGAEQIDLRLTEEALALGFDADHLGREVRTAIQGEEAIRQMRGRDELTVRVQLPEAERDSLVDLERMPIRTPEGGWIALGELAELDTSPSATRIERRDGRRVVEVAGDLVDERRTNQVVAAVSSEVVPRLEADFPGLEAGFGGRQEATADSLASLQISALGVLVVLYVMLAIPFASYTQPLVVMVAIPFGLIGALLGHLVMGYGLSIISIQGVIALAGLVVNASLVLVDYANRQVRSLGISLSEAAEAAALRRFRPIMLTTLTTFGGLSPMIFETSRQARFMVPMAISLGYGVLVSAVVTLLVVPALLAISEDLRALPARLRALA